MRDPTRERRILCDLELVGILPVRENASLCDKYVILRLGRTVSSLSEFWPTRGSPQSNHVTLHFKNTTARGRQTTQTVYRSYPRRAFYRMGTLQVIASILQRLWCKSSENTSALRRSQAKANSTPSTPTSATNVYPYAAPSRNSVTPSVQRCHLIRHAANGRTALTGRLPVRSQNSSSPKY